LHQKIEGKDNDPSGEKGKDPNGIFETRAEIAEFGGVSKNQRTENKKSNQKNDVGDDGDEHSCLR